jgi:outer membrane protein TolC
MILMTCFSILSLELEAKVLEINYNDLPDYVKSNNQKIKSKKYLVDGYSSQKNHFAKSLLPEVIVSGGVDHFKTRDLDFQTDPKLNLTARVNLFNSGRDILENKIRNYQYEISKLKLKNEYLEQLTLARYLFVSCNYFKKQEELINQTLINLKKLYQQTNQQFQSGLISSTDLNSIEIYQDQLNAELILVKEEFEHTLDELKIAIGVNLNTDLKLSLDHQHLSFEDNSYQENPKLKNLEKEIEISKIKNKKYNLWWAPSLDVYSSYELHTYRSRELFDHQDRDDYVTGIQINLPIFDKLNHYSKARFEKMKSKALIAEYDYLDQEIKAEIKKLKHGLEVRDDLIHRFTKTVKISEDQIKKTEEEFLTGIKNSNDIITAFESFLARSYQYHQYVRDYSILKAKLLAIVDENI